MGRLILALDLGSSFLKAVVFDEAGRCVAATSQAYTTTRPGPDLAEQDPDHWIDLIETAARQLWRDGVDPEQVLGIGLSARGALAIFLDEGGRVLSSCWLDRRSQPAGAALRELLGEDLDYQTRSLASKTFHLRRSDPSAFERLRWPLMAKDFLLYRLTGEVASDPSSGPPDGIWPARLWEAVGFPVERLAPIRPHSTIGGRLRPEVAARLGLRPGLPVGVGGHDGACANLGAGAIFPGQVCLTLGTQGVARTILDAPPSVREPGVSPYPFLPGRWCCSGNLTLAGAAPTFVGRLLAETTDDSRSIAAMHARLTDLAREVPPGSRGVLYLPFPGGLVSPAIRPKARAAFVGMSADTGCGELYRAALEGVACAFRSVMERQREVGLRHEDLRLSGGGAQNDLWARIFADVLDLPVTVVEPEEGPRGAAMFLAVGLGWFDSPDQAAAAWVRPVARHEPSSARAAYDRVYRRYRRVADAVYEAADNAET